eukprot:GHVH01007054.1.p1 GENE.GHVH01007054.1~~GHVH01007054.1.p1  ORF type:complete len:749 (+),score=122.75 GHVH01007054.1:168-2414(+)
MPPVDGQLAKATKEIPDEYDSSSFEYEYYDKVIEDVSWPRPFYKNKFELTEKSGYTQNGKSPEDAANIFSRLTFLWLNPIIYRGKNETITEWELPQLRAKDRAGVNTDDLKVMWEAEVKRVRAMAKNGEEVDWSQISIGKLMARFVSPQMYYSIPMKLTYDLLQYASPLIMSSLVNWLTGYQDDKAAGEDVSKGSGVGFVFAYLFVGFVSSFILQQYFHNQNKVGLRLKTAMMGIVYNKALNCTDFSLAGMMDPDGVKWTDDVSKSPTTIGQVLNMITVDSTRLYAFCTYCHTLWSAPFQIIVGTGLLIFQLGWWALMFVPVVLVMMPLTLFITRQQHRLTASNMIAKDKRLSKESEAVNSMKVIKMYGWEEAVMGFINDTRTEELGFLKQLNRWSVAAYIGWTLVPTLSTIIVFGSVYAGGGDIDSGTAYSCISVFNLLRFPIAMLPNLITSVATIKTALDRLKSFLLCPEFDSPTFAVENTRDEYSIKIAAPSGLDNVHLVHPDGVPMLRNVDPKDLVYARGSHTAIVGRVGTGKSSLLGFYTGNLRIMNGIKNRYDSVSKGERLSASILKDSAIDISSFITMNGKVAFVPQSAWVINATVRQNIVMGEEFDVVWYKRVLIACELVPDLRLFVDGDLTEIGEKGINLSGGQRQRIALARACYRRADINLFDDVLSALDSQVGLKIMQRVVNGLLKDKTVIMVTHAVQYLDQFDTVQFLNDERIEYSRKLSISLSLYLRQVVRLGRS